MGPATGVPSKSMPESEKTLVYLILGAAGSGRREVLADLIEGASGGGEGTVVLLEKGEAAGGGEEKLGNVARWRWNK